MVLYALSPIAKYFLHLLHTDFFPFFVIVIAFEDLGFLMCEDLRCPRCTTLINSSIKNIREANCACGYIHDRIYSQNSNALDSVVPRAFLKVPGSFFLIVGLTLQQSPPPCQGTRCKPACHYLLSSSSAIISFAAATFSSHICALLRRVRTTSPSAT